ncbi:MAG: type II toxin-antitoxin system PemK/MazF family toxin [Deltaproteobacteria bacterium]|nr:type II toxin-antitoxin system PemK/MazF family toxin [Deltaproteobacteria bacterium]MBM4323571.1 type II toxin-antitoxin system PemK/MazF family toxin [Deltaproteobacteria bacterium]MBM4347075.1 type II toxin-antitoxin system PemK/MazF family toxin [Deltaproteobacteria bacterium]
MEIRKWNVYLADLNPRFGTEPGKTRPVVVVQTDLLNNHHPSTIICPLTTQIRPQSDVLRVHLRKGEAGLMERSDIMADQLRAIDNRRFVKKLGMIQRLSQKRLLKNIQIMLN